MVTFRPGVVTCVVAHFSSLKPSSVLRSAQQVIGPGLSVLYVVWMTWLCPGGRTPKVQMSWRASPNAGGVERIYCRPSGTGVVTVMDLLSIRPVLLMVVVKTTSPPRAAKGGAVWFRATAGACHSTVVSPRNRTMPAPLGAVGSGGRMISTAMRLTPGTGTTSVIAV